MTKRQNEDEEGTSNQESAGPDETTPPPAKKPKQTTEKKTEKKPAKSKGSKKESSPSGSSGKGNVGKNGIFSYLRAIQKNCLTLSAVFTNSEGDKFIDLGKKRRATVRSFKGSVLVDIREFYGQGDDLQPGKKGISLSPEQWAELKANANTIDSLIKKLQT